MNVGHLMKRRDGTSRDILECAKIVKDTGFDFIDFSGNYYLENDGWLEKTKKIKEGFDALSLKVNQTHAPYVFEKYGEEEYREYMRRAFEINAAVGSEYIVIHADKYLPGDDGYDSKRALCEIYDFYAPYVEYAKKSGFFVAIENLFEPVRDSVRTRFTSTIEE